MDEGFKKQKVISIGEYKLKQLRLDKTDEQLNQELLDLSVARNAIKPLFETKEPSIGNFPVTSETTLNDLPSVTLLGRVWSETIVILLKYFDKNILIRDLPKEIEKRIQRNNKVLLIRYEK
jgi:hypothetical protein